MGGCRVSNLPSFRPPEPLLQSVSGELNIWASIMAKRRQRQQDFRARRVFLFEANGDDNKAMVIIRPWNMTKNLRNHEEASWWGCRSWEASNCTAHLLGIPITHPLSICSPFAWHCLYKTRPSPTPQTLIFLCQQSFTFLTPCSAYPSFCCLR